MRECFEVVTEKGLSFLFIKLYLQRTLQSERPIEQTLSSL